MSLVGAQLGTAIILAIGALICGNLPVLVIRYLNKKNGTSSNIFHSKSGFGSKVLSFLMCFGGGVLFATCFVHLIPEVQERFEEKGEHGEHHHHENSNDTTEENDEHEEHHHHHDMTAVLIISAGFFLVFAIEEILHIFLANHHHHGDYSEEGPPPKPRRRTVSCISDEIRASGEHNIERYTKRATSLSPVREENDINIQETPQNGKPPAIASNRRTSTNISESSGSNYQRQIDIDESHCTSVEEPTVVNMIRGLMIVVALSFHSVFEGLAVGLQNKASLIWTIGMAIAVHKFVIAFVVGLEVYSQTLRPKIVVIYLTAFSLMSPLGIIIAMGTGSGGENASHSKTADVLNAIAAGTIIYVVFFEILQKERHTSLRGIYQLLAIVLGFGLMVGIQKATAAYHVD